MIKEIIPIPQFDIFKFGSLAITSITLKDAELIYTSNMVNINGVVIPERKIKLVFKTNDINKIVVRTLDLLNKNNYFSTMMPSSFDKVNKTVSAVGFTDAYLTKYIEYLVCCIKLKNNENYAIIYDPN